MKYLVYPFQAAPDGDAGGGTASNNVDAASIFNEGDDKGQTLEQIFEQSAKKAEEEAKKDGDGNEDQPPARAEESKEADNPPAEVFDLTEKGNRFKLGEREFTAEEVQAAFQDHEAKANWLANMTKKSQMMNWFEKLPSDVQEKILANNLAMVYGKENLPEDYKPEAFEFDVSLTGKDEYDGEIKLDGKRKIEPGSDEWKALENHFEKHFKVKYQDAFTQIKQYQEQNEQFVNRQKQWEKETGQSSLKGFIKDQGFSITTDGDIENTIKQILLAGETHPSHADVMRLTAIGNVAETHGVTLEKAAEILYGKPKGDKAKNQANNDRKKQAGVKPEKPGGSDPALSDDAAFLKTVVGEGANRHSELWGGKL